jgi:hypothetical protein
MTTATYDWPAIGVSGNPFPGDPNLVSSAASKYSSVAQSVLESAASLRSAVAASGNLSAAVAEFTELALEVATTMDAIHERYLSVADQLGGYAPVLVDAHTHAAGLYVAITTALHDRERQRNAVIYLDQQLAGGATGPESLLVIERTRTLACERLLEIEATLGYYRAQIEEHSDRLDAAAAAAADAIDAVVGYADLNDGFGDVVWDGMVVVSQWVLEHAESISMVLDVFSFLLTIAAFVVLFTGVGAPIAAALFAIARACNVISRVLVAVRIAATAVLVADGKRPLSDLVMVAVDVGAGKLVDKAADALADRVATRLLDAVDPMLLMVEDATKHMDDDAIDLVLKHLPLDAVQDIDTVVDVGIDRFAAEVLVAGSMATAAEFDISQLVGTALVDPFVVPAVQDRVGSAMAPS